MRAARARLSDLEAKEPDRFDCGPDWNLALGGGVPAGAIVLVASRGGSGKTTEMLRVAARLGTATDPAYYFFSERTGEELSAHAKLIDADRSRIIPIGPVTSIEDVCHEAPTGAHIILDSYGNLQTRSSDPSVDVQNLREQLPSSVWIICHVNKRGDLEGREKLSHAATAVVWVRKKSLRTSKNWYGPQVTVPRELPNAFGETTKKPAKVRPLRAV